MASQTLQVIESLQEAIRQKKQEFRNQRGKAYLPPEEEEEEDDLAAAPRDEERSEEENEEDEEEKGGFKRDRQNFMRRKRADEKGPSIALFGKSQQGSKPAPKQDAKAKPGQGKA
jgi:hypothetical protein